MADAEFAANGDDLRERLRGLPRRDAIALACRGSADPAGLAWLAEALKLGAGQLVIDVGGGTGGPAAWLEDRYDCRVVVVDPVGEAAAVAADVLGVRAVVADGARLPLAGRADAVLALGVLSVTDEPAALLAEARRLTSQLGVLEWCARGDAPIEAGGSHFPPVRGAARPAPGLGVARLRRARRLLLTGTADVAAPRGPRHLRRGEHGARRHRRRCHPPRPRRLRPH